MILIFDCDGVVIDSTILHTQAEALCFSNLGIPMTQKQVKDRFAGMADAAVFKALEDETGKKLPDDIRERLDAEKRDLFAQKLKAMDGIHDALQDIRDIPSCVASSSSPEMLNYTLSLTDLLDYFKPRIYSSEMVLRGKPFPDIFLFAAFQMKARPEDCIVIEDSAAGVRAGKAAGSYVIGFAGGSHCDENHAVMLQTAGADSILSSMKDLPKFLAGIKLDKKAM